MIPIIYELIKELAKERQCTKEFIVYCLLRKLEEEEQISILFQLGKDLTSMGEIIESSDNKKAFDEFIKKTDFRRYNLMFVPAGARQ